MSGGSGEDGFTEASITENWGPPFSVENILRTLDIAFQNQLTINSARAAQPPEILLPLREHQRALIAAMEEREKGSQTGIPFKNTVT